MGYTKGKWEVVVDRSGDIRLKILHGNRVDMAEDIAIILSDELDQALGDANLTATAVNSCISLNPSNPQAAADGIMGVVEALELYRTHQEGTSDHYCWKCNIAITEALASIKKEA